jgi:2-methylisocitrate lyase-like PEP mutase family enzyme
LRYQNAGVDLVFVDGVKTVAEVQTVARRVSGPKVVSIVDGTQAAVLTADELQEMGFTIVLYAVTTLFSAAGAVQQALTHLQAHGTPHGIQPPVMPYSEFSDVVGLPAHQSLDQLFGAS